MITCLIVDDDPSLRELLAEQLTRYGLVARTAADARAMRLALQRGGIDLLLLDLMLPDADGFEICKVLRAESKLPIIMLTARGDPISRILGLEVGADDFVTKPFDPRELLARIHALVRRSAGALAAEPPAPSAADAPAGRRVDPFSSPVSPGFAGWQVDWRNRMLISPANVALALSNVEYRLLAAFAERPGEVLSRPELVAMTRGATAEGSERGIDLAISRLRAKLGESPDEPRFIRTVRGRGYQFAAPLMR